jgi:hypothetical protein
MVSFCTIEETIFNVPNEQAFLGVVPINLSSIFTGFGPLPAVSGVTDQTGDWDAAGQTRSVSFSDGSSVKEKLTGYNKPQYFSYILSDFTGVLRLLATSANGDWWFEPVSEDKTHVKWRYVFNSRNIFTIPFLWFITKALWKCYMKKALSLSKNQIEANVN